MKDALFIINPISGKGRKEEILSFLKQNGCNVVCTEYAGHAEKLARDAKEEVIVAVGGDGTVNEVARGITGTGKIMGIVPCGSGDGLALCLGISRNYEKAFGAIQEVTIGNNCSLIGEIDCCEMESGEESRPFFSVCGVGLDANVSERFAQAYKKNGRRGIGGYIREALKEWIGFKPGKYEIAADGQKVITDAVLITVANSNQWGNNARIAPLSLCGDSLLDVTVIENFHSWEIPGLALKLMTGHLGKSRHVRFFRGQHIKITRLDGKTSQTAHCDGDYFTVPASITARITGRKIKVIRP